jgi:hypothetical protein
MQVYAELYRRRTGRAPHRAKLYFLNELKGPQPPLSRPINAVLEVSLPSRNRNARARSTAPAVYPAGTQIPCDTWYLRGTRRGMVSEEGPCTPARPSW